ncbi:MAG: UvrD-helicase domain-containing protein [candidate division WOR-3 bacterium]|nr:MAG: UvrD-helicase domain-containing protein [candidate division WOR-3 bacterium]
MLQKKLGKYEIMQWLGGGRFGDVFLARDTILDKQFAIKVSRMRKEEIAMLKDEAKLLAALDHPNIVRFYNINFIEDKFIMVMEYIEGATLRDIITDRGIIIDRMISIATQTLNALSYAHSQKVLHRDLKPENILITEKGTRNIVKITDFGLARFIRAGSISASTAGTPVYMAPEVWSGHITEKSDIWSIGVVLYELLTGVPPFMDDSLDGLKRKIDRMKVLVPTVLRPDIPEHVEDAIMKCLSLNPRARPHAYELLQMFSETQKGIEVERGVAVPEKEPQLITLTPSQRDVIDALNGTILLLGQAGCGKTTTLTYAVAKLIEQDIPVSKILICTFTNKAANDIRERLQKAVTFSSYDLWLGTFHTLGLRIVRRDAERIDVGEDFTISEPRKIFHEMDIRAGKYRTKAIMKFIETLKAQGIAPDGFNPKNEWESSCLEIYEKYQRYLKDNNIVDYDDLILHAMRILGENDDIREYYKSLFNYIFVDELQDINAAQYRLVSLLFKHNIFFTGDEDQAIYGWRGADKELIYRVPKDYPDIKTFYLTKSFRLPQGMLEIANNLMLRKTTAIPTPQSGDVLVYAAQSQQDEADYVVKEIKRLKKEQFYFQDMALLYRLNSLSRVYEEALIKSRIPHTLIGGASFYERADIKPLIEYLELLERYVSDSIPSAKTKEEFTAKARTLLGIQKRSGKRAQKLFEYHLNNALNLSPYAIMDEITSVAHLRGENVEELKSLAKGFSSPALSQFLNEMRLIQELDLIDWGKDTLKLMTIHSAKGLEFPIVFVVDLVEDIIPLTKKMASQKEIEEERRLCYVALTRAQKKLYLLYPKRRYGRYQKPSRFLVDMFKTAS